MRFARGYGKISVLQGLDAPKSFLNTPQLKKHAEGSSVARLWLLGRENPPRGRVDRSSPHGHPGKRKTKAVNLTRLRLRPTRCIGFTRRAGDRIGFVCVLATLREIG